MKYNQIERKILLFLMGTLLICTVLNFLFIGVCWDCSHQTYNSTDFITVQIEKALIFIVFYYIILATLTRLVILVVRKAWREMKILSLYFLFGFCSVVVFLLIYVPLWGNGTYDAILYPRDTGAILVLFFIILNTYAYLKQLKNLEMLGEYYPNQKTEFN